MQRRASADLSHVLPDILAPWGLAEHARTATRLTGGNLHDMFRIDTPTDSFALRVYAEDTIRSRIDSSLPWIQHIARQLPEVPAFIPTANGPLIADAHHRFATLTTFIEGSPPDASNPAHRAASARALARIHRASATIPNPQPRHSEPAWRDLDWHNNHILNVADIFHHLETTTFPPGIDGPDIRDYVQAGLENLSTTFARLNTLNLADLVLHGDFYDQNLIARDNQIVGIVDWDDDMRLDWRAWDIANAAREFSRGPHTAPIHVPTANRFIADYIAAGGEITAGERSAVLDLIRLRILWETLYDLAETTRGYGSDYHYIQVNIHTADHLSPEDFKSQD